MANTDFSLISKIKTLNIRIDFLEEVDLLRTAQIDIMIREIKSLKKDRKAYHKRITYLETSMENILIESVIDDTNDIQEALNERNETE